MAKKNDSKKPSVKVEDLAAKKNPKGGATDIFAKLGDIKGESLDSKHKDQIELTSRDASTGLPTGKRTHKPIR